MSKLMSQAAAPSTRPPASRKTRTKRPDTKGFGVPNVIDPHHFVVEVPSSSRGDVVIRESFGLRQSAGAGTDEIVRCILPRAKWTAISNEVKRHFNERLRAEGMRTSRWSAGENGVNRMLGKELVVLAWAIELADNKVLGRAVRNWMGLKPEERWWLFMMTAAASGRSEHTLRGWRMALFHALTENPDSMDLTKLSSSPARNVVRPDDQLSLLEQF